MTSARRALAAALPSLLAAAFIIIAAGGAPAPALAQDSPGDLHRYQMDQPPATPVNLTGQYSATDRYGEYLANRQAQLDWADGASGTALCLPVCVTHYDAGAPHRYTLEWRQPAQQNDQGIPIAGEFEWTELATTTGTRHDFTPHSGPSRELQFRVKACNNIGCSGWSATLSITVGYN